AAFPGVEMHFRTVVRLYGQTVPTDARELSLDGCDLSDAAPLKAALENLPDLTAVTAADARMDGDELLSLMRAFPDVTFRIPADLTLAGQTVATEATDLDLAGQGENSFSGDELRRLLALFPNLKTADLTGTLADPEAQLQLALAFPDVTFRWQVDVAGAIYDSTVQELDFTGNQQVTPALLRARLPLFSGLTRVEVTDCPGENEAWGAIRKDFPGVKLVWRLQMGDFSLKTDDLAFSVLIMKDDKRAQLHSADLEVLQYCTDLQALDLGHQLLTDISAIGNYLPELRILILADNQISDLSPLAKLKHLHYLEIFVNSTQLNDLSPLAQCRELVDLNISYLYGPRDFSALYDLPLLERLWAEHTHLSVREADKLQERYPNATIVIEGEGSVDNGWRTHSRYYAMLDMFHKKDYVSERFSRYDGQ
ncbi:MAG: leucine-rich repeat domain-containing protein, partial [Clostridia bacterium]|nr:leucine-rich repeat domain-containing protein [Clostridia bacterium]